MKSILRETGPKGQILVSISSLTGCEGESRSVVSVSLWPQDYAVHGILQARILEWAAVPFSRGSSNPGIESRCPTLQVDSLPAEPQGKTRIPIVARILIGIHVSTAPSVTLFFLSKVFSQAESDFHDYCINSFCQFSDTSLPSRCYWGLLQYH